VIDVRNDGNVTDFIHAIFLESEEQRILNIMGETQRVKRQACDSQILLGASLARVPMSKRQHSADDTNSNPQRCH
jgi:hypothetical protein